MTVEEAAAEIREHAAAGRAVRPRGGGTKLDWSPAAGATVDFDAQRLDRIVEHNEGDFTAILEAGVPLVEAQAQFGRAGQMLALDPPLGAGDAATLGGVIATNDSGPLRHRYGGVRDLVVGITVVLSDGTVAQSGGKVIKNVAGYDLAKLFAGSFGTLGLIARVAVRLHPAPERTATLSFEAGDAGALARTARALAALPLEADSLDVSWEGDAGRVAVRFGGATAVDRAHEAARHVELGEPQIVDDDQELWARERARQRRPDGVVIKVSSRPTDLETIIAVARDAGASVVARAALGLAWIAAPADVDVGSVRDALAPRACTVLDGAERVSEPWPVVEPGALAVMERIKERFDPARTFRPGAFVGGL